MAAQPIRLIRHARNRMRWDNISQEDVEHILEQPEAVTPTERGRSNAWGRYWVERTQTAWLTVTFIREHNQTVVITVTPRRRGPGGS